MNLASGDAHRCIAIAHLGKLLELGAHAGRELNLGRAIDLLGNGGDLLVQRSFVVVV